MNSLRYVTASSILTEGSAYCVQYLVIEGTILHGLLSQLSHQVLAEKVQILLRRH